MLDYVRGEVAELAPANAVIDCQGVGYMCNISLNTYSAIQGKKEAKLYVYEAIREDAHVLFGFASKQERELFLLLIRVSGIFRGNDIHQLTGREGRQDGSCCIASNTRDADE